MLLAVYPIQAYAILAWGLVGIAVPYGAPFYMAAVSCIFLKLYAMPLTSSFRFPVADSRTTTGLIPMLKPRPDSARTYSVSQGTERLRAACGCARAHTYEVDWS